MKVTKNDIVMNESVYEDVVTQIQQNMNNEYSYSEFYDLFGGIEEVDNNVLICYIDNKLYTFSIDEKFKIYKVKG